MKKMPVFTTLLLFSLAFPNIAYAVTTRSVPILMYHYIGDNSNPRDKLRNSLSVKLNDFKAPMAYLVYVFTSRL